MPKDGSKEPLDIVVVGGSLGGLCAGVALKTHGHNVTICERNPKPVLEDQGAGVVAGGDTQRFFDKYDRCAREMSCKSEKRLYLDRSGAIIHEENNKQHMTSWDTVYYILRANFDGVQSDYCKVPAARSSDGKVTYSYGTTVTGLEEQGDKVRVSYTTTSGKEESLLADLVLGADGPSSTVRRLLVPNVQRKLAGYCALRGTVPENEASEEARAVFVERFSFFHADGTQVLAYTIPGLNGDLRPGHRLLNFVWYRNFPADSEAFARLMTDRNGERHRYTLPPGLMAPEVWEELRNVATETLPPQFAELALKTSNPFAQAVTDVISPTNGFFNRKVLLLGDALAGFRPHTVASTSQAAFDASQIARYVQGDISWGHLMHELMPFARHIQARGVDMGNRSQFAKSVPLEDHIQDRNRASTPRKDESFPDWAFDGLPEVKA